MSAPPAPRLRPSQPRPALAKSGPARCPPEQFVVKSLGLPRFDQVSPPSSVRKRTYFRHWLAEHVVVSTVKSQALEVVAASSRAALPVAVCSLDCQVVPPSLVSWTSTVSDLGVSSSAIQPRLALAKRMVAMLAWRSVVQVRPPSVVRWRYDRHGNWHAAGSMVRAQPRSPSTA